MGRSCFSTSVQSSVTAEGVAQQAHGTKLFSTLSTSDLCGDRVLARACATGAPEHAAAHSMGVMQARHLWNRDLRVRGALLVATFASRSPLDSS